MTQDIKTYRVTIHEHKIYDSFIPATSWREAEEIAENQIIEEDSGKWREDFDAGWTEVGDIYNESDEQVN
jgi:hypothetical protein